MTPEDRITRAARDLTTAKAERDAAIRDGLRAGLSLRTVARLAQLSHQRVAAIRDASPDHQEASR